RDRLLTAATRVEGCAADEHGPAGVRLLVEDETLLGPPRGEQPVLEPGARDPLEVDGRDDLVGVDVRAAQRHADAGVGAERFHQFRSSGLDRVPRTAVAAATSGDTRCVRPPLPWRPSKLRLEVDALRSPGASWSGFMPRHIEQPAERHSAPAALNTSSRPSASACARTRIDPGTTSIRTPSATLRPLMTSAAARRSSMRPLVQEPTNTVSTRMSRSGVPGSSPM